MASEGGVRRATARRGVLGTGADAARDPGRGVVEKSKAGDGACKAIESRRIVFRIFVGQRVAQPD